MHWETRELSQLAKVMRVAYVRATSGLESMLGHPIQIDTTNINLQIADITQIPSLFGNIEATVIVIYMWFDGDISGHTLLAFDRDTALQLGDALVRFSLENVRPTPPLVQSALCEVGNLLTSYFLTSLAQQTGLSARPSIPEYIDDMAGAILEIPLVEVAQVTDWVLLSSTKLVGEHGESIGQFVIIPDPTSWDTVRTKLALVESPR